MTPKFSLQNFNLIATNDLSTLAEQWRIITNAINKEFLNTKNITDAMQAGIYNRATAMDMLINALTSIFQTTQIYTICAIGGYGRGKLAPYSDIDIAIIYQGTLSDNLSQEIITLEQNLWDLGLKPSFCTFEENEFETICRQDHQRMTCFLDMRYIAGDPKTYDRLSDYFRQDICKKEQSIFIAHKLQERDERHKKMGNSRYFLEPNIKENKGGLRDLQTLHWITNYLYDEDSIHILKQKNILNQEEAESFYHASDFLWVVRCHLHLLSNKAEEVLRFDSQLDIAERMGYRGKNRQDAAEKFMKDYFHTARKAGYLTRIFCAILEEKSLTAGLTETKSHITDQNNLDDFHGYSLKNGRIHLSDEFSFKDEISEIIRIFNIAQKTKKPLHPESIRKISRAISEISATKLQKCVKANNYFMNILMTSDSCEAMLRLMQETGVLAKIIPAFGAISAHMQYDMYHVFTADEHLIHAIGLMHQLNDGKFEKQTPKAHRIIQKITEKRALFVAIMLHDIAKGTGEDHSVAGARLAKQLGPRLGLSVHEVKLTEWLVLNHLEMSKMALNRDIYDLKTIDDFCAILPNPEYLRLLYVLTVIDIMAVGPGRWNSWKENLLDQLYDLTYQKLTGGRTSYSQHIEDKKSAISSITPDCEVTQIWTKHAPPNYWHSYDIEQIKQHIAFATSPEHQWQCGTHIYAIHAHIDPTQRTTEIFIKSKDRKGLFSTLLEGFMKAQSQIIDARIYTFDNGDIWDIFTLQNKHGEAYDNLDFLYRKMEETCKNPNTVSKPASPPPITPSTTTIMIDNQASHDNTLIEISCQDRSGLLYDIARTMAQLNLQIISAKISTYGQNAVDTFYVRDAYGLKITKEHAKTYITQQLKQALR